MANGQTSGQQFKKFVEEELKRRKEGKPKPTPGEEFQKFLKEEHGIIIRRGGTGGAGQTQSPNPEFARRRAEEEARRKAEEQARIEEMRRRGREEQARREQIKEQEKRRVFFAKERGETRRGVFIPAPEEKQFVPPDFDPSRDVVVRTRTGVATGRGAGRVRVERGTPTIGRLESGKTVRSEVGEQIKSVIPPREFSVTPSQSHILFEKRVIGKVTDKKTGREIPRTAFFVAGTDIRATQEQEKQLRSQPKDLVISDEPRSVVSKVLDPIKLTISRSDIKENLKRIGKESGITGAAKIIAKPVRGGFGMVEVLGEEAIKVETSREKISPTRLNVAKFITGVGERGGEFVEKHPIQTVATGVAVGGGVSFARAGLRTVGPRVGAGGELAGIVGGGFLIGQQLEQVDLRIAQTPDFREKGGVVGEEIARTGLFLTGAGVGSSVVRRTLAPTTTTVPVRSTVTPEVLEIKAPVVTPEGRFTTLSSFRIIGEATPPTAMITTTPVRKALGLRPLETKFTPARGFIQETTQPVIGRGPVFFREVIQGRKTQKFGVIRGDTRAVSVSSISKLTPLERFTVGKIIETRTGLPAGRRPTELLFGREADIRVGGLVQKTLVKGRFRKGTLLLEPVKPGKRVTRSVVGSELKPFAESPKIEVLTGETQFKDVTFPFARARGRSPALKETLVVLKEPVVLEAPSKQFLGKLKFERNVPVFEFGKKFAKREGISPDVRGFTMVEGPFKGFVFVKKGLKESVREEVIAHEKGHIFINRDLKRFEKLVSFKEAKAQLRETYGEDVPYPRSKFKAEVLADAFAGEVEKFSLNVFKVKDTSLGKRGGIAKKTPLSKTFQELQSQLKIASPKPPPPKVRVTRTTTVYTEPTTVFGRPSRFVGTGQFERTEGGLAPRVSSSDAQIIGVSSRAVVRQEPAQIPMVKQSPILRGSLKSATKPITKLIQRPEVKTELRPGLRLAQKQKLKLAQKLKLKQTFKTGITTVPPPTLSVPIPKDPTGGFPKLKKRKRKKKKKGRFTVEVRRFGEFKTIGKAEDISKAVSIGRERVAGTLGATFRIKGAERGIPTPAGFRRPRKTTKLTAQIPTFIEKREFRLSRPGEKREIKRAKKTKKRKRR